jgi:hypothetical protein
MRVRIVCYEDLDLWILGKFAKKLNKELQAMSIDSDIAMVPDNSADINHHIIYWHYDGSKSSIDTLMVTHIDTIDKLKMLKEKLTVAEMGICMSQQTVNQLAVSGIPRDRLCYVNPAHDDIIKPRKTVIGLTCQTHPDGRKREHYLVDIAARISPDEFMFKIMGKGWQSVVNSLTEMGFSVEYHPEFHYDTYVTLVPSFDYYLYFSFDEGSMGYVDALAAGVKTIVTPQGYHLDADGGITYAVNDKEDVIAALEEIAREKRKIAGAVSNWLWSDYARKHVDIWQYLISNRSDACFAEHSKRYQDGLRTVRPCEAEPAGLGEKLKTGMQFIKNSRSYYNLVNRFKLK